MSIPFPIPSAPFCFGRASAALLLCILPLVTSAATIDQTVASTGSTTAWNAVLWGSPVAAPTAGNTYRAVAGTTASTNTGLLSGGAPTVTGRVRAYSAGATFAGGSLEILSGAELLLKDTLPVTFNANLILNGGVVRLSPDTGGSTATLTGTLDVAADSYVGVVQTAASTLTINSTITGGGTVRLLAGGGASQTISLGGNLSGFTGTFDIGGGVNHVTVKFTQAYDLSGAVIAMRSGNGDVLQLGGDVTVGDFSFGGTTVAPGTYTLAQLNGLYGTGSQFTGTGSLTIGSSVGTAYYIDSVNGSESNPGTQALPWQSISPTSKINTLYFQPGDRLYFKRGCSWTGMIELHGPGGSSTAPITIGAYGPATDPAPVINGNGADAAILLWTKSYVTVRDLDIMNWPTTQATLCGIRINYVGQNGTFSGIKILNNKIHDVYGISNRDAGQYNNAAIYVDVMDNGSGTRLKYDSLLIEGNDVYNTTCIGLYAKSAPYSSQSHPEWWATNVVIRNNTFDQMGADDLVLNGMDAPLVEYNAGYDAGVNGSGYRAIAGMWTCYYTRETVFQFNEVARTRNEFNYAANGDGQAFDVDYGTIGNHTFQYNYTHDNAGGILIVMPKKDATSVDLPKAVVYRYNLSVNDGRNTSSASQFPAFPVLGTSSLNVYNNTIYTDRPEGLKFVNNNASYFTNNIFYALAAIYPSNPWFSNNCYYNHVPDVTDAYKIVADPKFAGLLPAAGPIPDGFLLSETSRFQLQSTSPCINAGQTFASPGTRDLWGNPLYAGGYADIGAHEVVGGNRPVPPAPTFIDDADAAVTYSSGTAWTHVNDDYQYYAHTKSGTGIDGQWVQLTFTGTNMSLFGRKGPGYGKMNVSVDGGAAVTIDCYWPVELYRVELHRATGLSNSSHTIRYTVAGKNPISTSNYAGIDYFQASAVTPPALPVATNFDHTAATYTGSWITTNTEPYLYGGTRKQSETVGDYFEITFTGTGVRVYAPKVFDCGQMTFTINGGMAQTVNYFSPVSDWSSFNGIDRVMKVYEINGLSQGTYTLRGTVATKDPLSTGNKISIDFIQQLVGGTP